MYLPVMPAVHTSEIRISGDVTIDDSAVIAPGVILEAAQGCKIIIGAGVCIGMGSILKAYQGTINVKDNAVLGAGALVIGNSTIHSQVCLGTSSTIYNISVESGSIIPSGSILGDPTRSSNTSSQSSPQEKETQLNDFVSTTEEKINEQYPQEREELKIKNNNQFNSNVNKPKNHSKKVETENIKSEVTPIETKYEQDLSVSEPDSNIDDPWQSSSQSTNINQNPVVGQVYIKNLLFTLFPEKKSK